MDEVDGVVVLDCGLCGPGPNGLWPGGLGLNGLGLGPGEVCVVVVVVCGLGP